MLSTLRKKTLIIIYDGDCPFCNNYVQLLSLKKTAGDVTLVNARYQDSVHIKEAIEHGLDLNDGMALKIDQHWYHGTECINILALMSSQHNWFNRVNYIIFRSPIFARLFYPTMKLGRRLTLIMLGIKKSACNPQKELMQHAH